MYANLASAVLIVIGAVLAALGLLAAGNMVIVGMALLAIFGGGLLSIAAQRASRPG